MFGDDQTKTKDDDDPASGYQTFRLAISFDNYEGYAAAMKAMARKAQSTGTPFSSSASFLDFPSKLWLSGVFSRSTV